MQVTSAFQNMFTTLIYTFFFCEGICYFNLLSNQMQLALYLLQRQKSLVTLKKEFLIAQKEKKKEKPKKKEGKEAKSTLYAEIN